MFYDNMGHYTIYYDEFRLTLLAAIPICLQSGYTRL